MRSAIRRTSSRGGLAAVAIHNDISDLDLDCFVSLAMTAILSHSANGNEFFVQSFWI